MIDWERLTTSWDIQRVIEERMEELDPAGERYADLHALWLEATKIVDEVEKAYYERRN